MGDWSKQAWGTDEAADWFQRFWKGGGIALLLQELDHFNPQEERYENVRAAAYLLQALGIVYVWPTQYAQQLKPALEKAISVLDQMIHPPNADWGFLDMWGSDIEVVRSVQEQIAALRSRLLALA